MKPRAEEYQSDYCHTYGIPDPIDKRVRGPRNSSEPDESPEIAALYEKLGKNAERVRELVKAFKRPGTGSEKSLERADILREIHELGLKKSEINTLFGKSVAWSGNQMRPAYLYPYVRQYIKARRLPLSKAVLLWRLDKSHQEKCALRIVNENLVPKEIQQMVNELLEGAGPSATSAAAAKDPESSTGPGVSEESEPSESGEQVEAEASDAPERAEVASPKPQASEQPEAAPSDGDEEFRQAIEEIAAIRAADPAVKFDRLVGVAAALEAVLRQTEHFSIPDYRATRSASEDEDWERLRNRLSITHDQLHDLLRLLEMLK